VHQHLTWSRILWPIYHSEEPGLWQVEPSLVALEGCEGCREGCPGLWEMAEAGEFSERLNFFELALKRSRWLANRDWQSLSKLPPELMRQALRRHPATYGLVDLLVEESHRQASMDRDCALLLAESAVEMAECLPTLSPDADTETQPLPEEALDTAVRAEMLALAHAVLGNAHRVAYRRWEAEAAFRQALVYLQETEEDARCELQGRARVLSMHASFLTDTRRLDAAIECLAEAANAAEQDLRCPTTLIADIAIKRSIALGLAHRDLEALTVLKGLKPALQGALPTRLRLFLRHRFSEQFLWCDNPRDARSALESVKQLCQRVGRGLDFLRVRWLEGRIVAAEGDLSTALQILAETQEHLLAEKAIHEAALLALEIAAVLHALGRLEETERHARQAVVLFLPLGLDEETLCALSLLADAACRRCLTPKLIDALLRYARGGEIPESALWT